MSPTERKLTTILAADVVGFSKLMGEDEAATVAALKACRSIIDGVIAEHHGRVFGSAGDSVLAEFSSPVEAVWCASDFQKLIAERNALPSNQWPMQYRVGITLGDVIIEGDNLYGDGVNVAARLESIAKPGGVCVSSKVYEEVKRKLDLMFVDGGMQRLKNIADPVAVYHVVSGEGTMSAAAPAAQAPASLVSEQPSVSVLPLKTIGGDEEIADLARGLTEDIVGGLARQAAITVIGGEGRKGAGGAHADFALEGSIRASGHRLRLSFALVDCGSGSQVWAERYDRQLDDVFDLQDEISRNVVSTVRIKVKAQALERLRDADEAALSVPDLLNKAAGIFVQSYADNEAAERLLRLAIAKAPRNSMANAMLAMSLHRAHEFSATDIDAEVRAEMSGLADAGISLDTASYYARLMGAVVSQDLRGDYETALAHAETALELNADYTQAQAMVGIARCHLGVIEDGIGLIIRAMEANKSDPQRFRNQRELAIAHFLAGRHDEAASAAARLVQQAPDLARNRPVLVSLLWHAGRHDAAGQALAALLREAPDFRLATARPVMFADDAAAERYLDGMRRAGAPE